MTRRLLDRAPAELLVLAAAFSVQGGAALATTLFEEAGPLGIVALRLGFGAVLLLVVYGRRLARARGLPLRWVLALGAILALMNSLFYASIDRIPLGVAVTVEFLGPLAVAVAGSRRLRDVAWVVLAGVGVALFGSPTVDVDGLGLGLAAAAGACWAAYIVVGQRLSRTWPVSLGLTASLAVAAVLALPAGLALSAGRLGHVGLLAQGLAVAVLSSVVVNGLELLAVRRLKASTFSILLSLEPAVAVLLGAVALSQVPGALEGLAVACVVAASVGASLTASVAPTPET